MLVSAQLSRTQDTSDTLAQVQTLINNGQFKPAISLLHPYSQSHPNALHLLGKTYYWDGQFENSRETYEKGLSLSPNDPALQSGLVEVLLSRKEYKESQYRLNTLLAGHPGHADGNYLMALLLYYKGELSDAQIYLVRALEIAPTHPEALDLEKDIHLAHAPRLELEGWIIRDDQVLTGWGSRISYAQNRSSLWNPQIRSSINSLEGADKTITFGKLGGSNTFKFLRAGLEIRLGVDALASTNSDLNLLWDVSMIKKFKMQTELYLTASYDPYSWTIASIAELPTYYHYNAEFRRLHHKGIQFGAGVIRNNYTSNTNTSSAYAWVLSPPLKLKYFQIRLGYNYSYTDSDNNLFRPVIPTEDTINGQLPEEPLEGVFDPFFTPEQTHIHMALIKLEIDLQSRIKVELGGNIGVFAEAQNPYFVVDAMADDYTITKGFYTEDFVPIEIRGDLTYTVSEKLKLNAGYWYFKSLFYQRHTGNLSMTVYFGK